MKKDEYTREKRMAVLVGICFVLTVLCVGFTLARKTGQEQETLTEDAVLAGEDVETAQEQALLVACPEEMLEECRERMSGSGYRVVAAAAPYFAGSARRLGADFVMTWEPLSEKELEDTGYRLAEDAGLYYLYESVILPGQWKITQYGTVSSLQSMGYSMVSRQGTLILVDGGYGEDAGQWRELIAEFGNRVDLWICSHFHSDHIGAVTEILADPQGITIEEIWCPPMDIDTYRSFAQEWDTIDCCALFLEETGGLEQVKRMRAGDRAVVADLEIDILTSFDEGREWTREGNNCGLMFRVTGGQESMLFCCDIGNEWISGALIEEYGEKLKADYVQMGHHGNGGLTQEAYRLVAPKAAFFDAPAWLFEDSERYSAAQNKEFMESLGCAVYLQEDAPNSILLR